MVTGSTQSGRALASDIRRAAVDGSRRVVAGIERGDGTVGKFLKDTLLYRDLRGLVTQADSVLADLKAKDQSGRTPLHLAVLNSYSSSSMVRTLLAGGADPLAEDSQKFIHIKYKRPLHNRENFAVVRREISK